jgi:hypothetical protein
MPHLTPALPPRYRRRGLAALGGFITRAKSDVAGRRATIERMAAAGEETTAEAPVLWTCNRQER